MKVLLLFVGVLWVGSWLPAAAESGKWCVDPEKSKFNIHVGSSGLFAAFGHDHLIEARDIKGCAEIDWSQLPASSVALTFAVHGLTVVDPKHPKDRPEVQKTMETEVLRVSEFPQIRFKSEQVHFQQQKAIVVDGVLTIRDHTERVSLPLTIDRVEGNKVKVTGRYSLKQSTYGIKPVKVAGGTIRVKDEINIDFNFVLAP